MKTTTRWVALALAVLGVAAMPSPVAAGEPTGNGQLPEAVQRAFERREQPGASEVVAAEVGTFDDPMSDMDPNLGYCNMDIRTLRVDYRPSILDLHVLTQCGWSNPSTDPSWTVGISSVEWYLDVDADDFDDYAVAVFNDGSRYRGGVWDVRGGTPQFVYDATPYYDYYGYGAQVGNGCIGWPLDVRVQAVATMDENPYGASCSCPIDVAPDASYASAVLRTADSRTSMTGDGPGVAALGTDGSYIAFARGVDDALWTRTFDGTSFLPWSSLGGVITGTPTAVSAQAGQVDVFSRGQDRALWTRHFDGSQWGAWRSLGGILSSPAAVVSAAPGEVTVFVAGFDRAMYRMELVGGVQGPWANMGGIITAMPAAASPAPDEIEVFARGQDAALWTQRFDGAWSGWTTLGGVITTAPAAVSATPGLVEVFARGQDRALWTRPSEGGVWMSLGGILTSPAAVVSAQAGDVDVLVRGSDAGLYSRHREGDLWAGDYANLGGIIK